MVMAAMVRAGLATGLGRLWTRCESRRRRLAHVSNPPGIAGSRAALKPSRERRPRSGGRSGWTHRRDWARGRVRALRPGRTGRWPLPGGPAGLLWLPGLGRPGSSLPVGSAGRAVLGSRPDRRRAAGAPRPHPLARSRGGRDDTPMGGDDGRHDGEAQTAAAARAGAGRVCPVEALEDAAGVFRRHAGPWSATTISAIAASASTRTEAGVPGGVCALTLANRLSTTWRSRSTSPLTSTGCVAPELHGPLGAYRSRGADGF